MDIHMQPQRTWGQDVASRYLSDKPLSSSKGSYVEHFPPLFHPLSGLKLPPCLQDSVERYPTKITTLPNGLRIASEDAPVNIFFSLFCLSDIFNLLRKMGNMVHLGYFQLNHLKFLFANPMTRV